MKSIEVVYELPDGEVMRVILRGDKVAYDTVMFADRTWVKAWADRETLLVPSDHVLEVHMRD